jgi:radical SAM protein with 4Fe4S-binding SPASM domain
VPKFIQHIKENARLVDWVVSAKKLKNRFIHYNEIHKPVPGQYKPIPMDSVIDYNDHRYEGHQKYICFAPFNSLFFDVRGKVVVCNSNRQYVVGDITRQTIREIWDGDTMEKLRQHIRHYDFSLGCSKCAEAILSKNYDAAFARSYDSTPQVYKNYPTRMEFEISSLCNLACTMCNGFLSSTYRKHFEKEEPYASVYDESFIEKLDEFLPHLKFTKFSGGEPFLIDLYYKIWERMAVVNPTCGIHVQTNGLILNNKVKRALGNGRFHIGVSLDGATAANYEKIRLFGKFDRVLENLRYFQQYCETHGTLLNIPFTPVIDTRYEVPDFIHLANRYHATAFFNVVFEPHTMAIWTLPSDELKSLLAFYEKQQFPSNTYIELKNLRQFESFMNQVRQWIIQAENRESLYPDYAGKSSEVLIEDLVSRLIEYDGHSLSNWFTGEPVPDPANHYRNILLQKLHADPLKTRETLIRMQTYDTERVQMEINVFFHMH